MPRSVTGFVIAWVLAAGCRWSGEPGTPAEAGINTRDVVDPHAQTEAEELTPADQLAAAAEQLRKERQRKLEERSKLEGGRAATKPNRSVLCLSGGGSFGAYSAGVLVGWSELGARPEFDVVTGISTGALIAPFAFLGPRYDAQLQHFYTALRSRDLYRLRPVRALFGGESFADTAPMAARLDAFFTPEVMCELAAAHNKGRRLYVGTTEQEGKQFVIWDLGAMAARGTPQDRDLMIRVLLGSAAPAGFFPSARIEVEVDGRRYTERHVDGSVSQSVFFRPPYVPPGERSGVATRDLAGTQVYVIVAGKLYADAEVIRPWSLAQASKSVSTLLYAQTRGDLQRLYTVCLLAGMDYYVSAIPQGYEAPTSSAAFDPEVMTALFEEGRRVIGSTEAWRSLPPGVGPGESTLTRAGPWLTYQQRGPLVPITGPRGLSLPPLYPDTENGRLPATPLRAPAK